MSRLHTPREVLAAVKAQTNKPWWATRLSDRMEKHLTATLFKGKPVIDTQMSVAACEAVIEEALNVVRMPDATDPVGEMLFDMEVRGRA